MRRPLLLCIMLCITSQLFGSIPFQVEPSVGLTYGFDEFTFSAGIDISAGIDASIGTIVPSVELMGKYHWDYYGFDEEGFEFRISPMLGLEGSFISYALGTNLWYGTGDLAKFRQRTGVAVITFNYFLFDADQRLRIIYENDGVPFSWVLLSDSEDRYRTAAFRADWEHINRDESYSFGLKFFTGNRNQEYETWQQELSYDDFGYMYPNGFVNEIGYPYRVSQAYVSYENAYMNMTGGIHYERLRHLVQNWIAHAILSFSRNRGFPVYDDSLVPVFSTTLKYDPVISSDSSLLTSMHTSY